MKQLLFLLLFPCLAMAQYPGNGNQKITLGEQTSADGLVYRGLAADTTRKPSVDTMAFILLDTNTNIIWQYKKATNNAWTRVGGSISSGLTGVLPVANGGTNRTTMPAGYVLHGDGTSVDTAIGLFWDRVNFYLGIGTASPTHTLNVIGNYQGTGNIISSAGFLRLSDGSATNPSVQPGLDGDTGFFRPGNNIIGFTTGGVEKMRITSNGNIGFGQTTPTAVLHLKAGTATASTAPLKFTSGTNLTTAEAGAMEFDGTNLLFTPSTTRHTVNHGLTGSATLEFLSTNAQNSSDMTITVTGAAEGDVVSLGVPNAAVNANTCYTAWVSAANTVTVRFNNYSSGTIDPASGLFKVFVTK